MDITPASLVSMGKTRAIQSDLITGPFPPMMIIIIRHISINGVDTTIQGHITDVYFQLAKTFLSTIPKEATVYADVFYACSACAGFPRPQDSTLYKNDTMPFPANFFSYNRKLSFILLFSRSYMDRRLTGNSSL